MNILRAIAFLGLWIALSAGSRAAEQPQAQVNVLYFHRTARCPSCLNMETYATEAVSRFPSERDSGHLAWRAVNIDEPADRHFQQDYALEFSSLVLSRREGGREIAWTNLPDAWALVGDKSNFIAHVEMEISKQLEQLPKMKPSPHSEESAARSEILSANLPMY